MRRLFFVMPILFILLTCSVFLRGNEGRAVGKNGDQGKVLRVNSINQDLHKNQLPYRDDADYSEHSNDLFQVEEEIPVGSPASRSVHRMGVW